MTTTAPIFVSDCRDDTYWHSVTKDGGDALRAWLRANGLEPDDIYRVEVYLVDCPWVKVFTYARDERGQFYRDGHEIARCEPFTVPLKSLPPGAEQVTR